MRRLLTERRWQNTSTPGGPRGVGALVLALGAPWWSVSGVVRDDAGVPCPAMVGLVEQPGFMQVAYAPVRTEMHRRASRCSVSWTGSSPPDR